MCSNNTGSNSACGCGTGGGNGITMWSSGLKKQQQQQQQQKRTRVPKRGPGVAELEKILREQETIDMTTSSTTTTTTNVETFSQQQPSSCFINHSSSSLKSHHHHHHHHQTSMPSSHHGTPPLVPRFDQLGRNDSGSQERELFPMNLTSCKSKSNINEVIGMDHGSQSESANSPSRNFSYPSTIQMRNNQFHPPPPQVPPLMQMNHFLGTTSNQVSSGSFSNGQHTTHQEPPSNQSSFYHYTSRLPEEHKMVGMKRVHTSSLDNSLIPPSNFQVLPSFSRYNRPHQSSTIDNHGISTYNSTNEGHRDAKWGSSLELSSRRFNSDIVGAASHANFPPFATPEVPPPPPMHLFQGVLSKGNVFSHQVTEDKMEDSYQRAESTSGADRKPFYNFLEVKDQEGLTDATHGSNHGGREAGRGGIDLSLKL